MPKLNPAAEPSSAAPRRSGTSHQHGRKRAIFVFAAFLLLAAGNARAQGTVATDRAALVALYGATDGANWTNNTNWTGNEALTDWHGVATDANGRITRLSLSGNGLSGEIPAELGDLTNLQNLLLNANTLSGEIPAELGDLTNLQQLWLSQNQLSGEIPAELGNLANLQNLLLYDNMLSGEIPAELGDLTNLQWLWLSQNQLSGEIPAELGGLANLQNLDLYQNQLSGEIPSELANLANLRQLFLWSNELSGEIPAELGGLANLQNLALSQNQLSGEIPAELGGLANLRWLYLHANMLTGEIPAELGDLTNLQQLTLSRNALSGEIPEELGDLANLQWLYLNDNELSGGIPAVLGDLANLQRLYLNDNKLTGEIPAKLGDLSNLQRLYLNDNELTGEIPSWLVNLTGLLELSLWSNQLTGMIPPEVAPAQDRAALRVLYNTTDGANWTDNTNWLSNEPLSEWYGVSTDGQGRVDELRLSANGLSGEIPPELENLANLQVFDVRNTGLSCVTPGSELHTWLETIDFRGAVCATRPPRPRTSAPGSPRNLTAAGGNGEVVLSWDAPRSDGGAAITDYEYRIDRRNPWISTGSTDTTHTVSGLVNGRAYVFEVRAVNRIGTSFGSRRAEAAPEAPPVFTLDFAHFANGAAITSDLVFVNLAPHPIRPAIYFYDTEGAPVAPDSVVDVTGDLEITEDGSLTVQTEMEPLGVLTISTHGQGELVSGSVKVVSEGYPIGGGVRYSLPDIGVAVVGASPPVRDVLFPARRQAGGIRTAAALHNLEEEAMGVRCRLMSGGAALEEAEIPLEANGQTSWFIEDTFTTTDTSDFAGSVHCAAPGRERFTAIAVEIDASHRIFTTLPLFPVDRGGGGRETALDFAHFANGDGTTSDLVFVNMKTEPSGPAPTPFHVAIPPIRPALYFYGTEGALVPAESVVDITGDLEVMEDGGLTVLTAMEPLGVLTISTHGQGPLVSGSVRVAADGPIGGVLRFDLPGIGVAGVGASPPVRDVLFPVRRQEGGINTGVAVHNLGEEAMEVTCELMQGGTVLEEVEIPLAANGQSSWFIDEVFTGADTSDFAGSVRCAAPEEGMFTGVAVELDAVNRIFTTLPVVPVEERMPQE